MKKLLIGTLLCISAVGFAQKNFIDQNYIEITGKAELEVSPDMIYVRIVLRDRDNKDKLPLAEIERRMISKLSELGIDVNNDLTLRDFASNLQTHFWGTNAVRLSKQYQLIVRDAKTLQDVFFEFQKFGVSNVSIQKIDHSKIEQFRKDVKVNAVKAAKEKAESLAVALNQNLGNAMFVQEVEEQNQNRNRPANTHVRLHGVEVIGYGSARHEGNMVGSVSSAPAPAFDSTETDIEFEKIKIESTFLVRFELKEKTNSAAAN